jgi:hypothetical protein
MPDPQLRREGDDWKIRLLAYNLTPAPAAR